MNQLIAGILEWLVSKPWQLFTDLVDWIKTFVTETLPAAIWSILPDGIADHLNTLDLQALDDLLDIAGWWIPFWELVAIYFVAYTISATIRLVRAVVGLIPTVKL
ncbi:MAG: hypothetical protein JJ974_09905 [Phycisphaerales bacterium]|nr:hypothetical protein [Phycisphaerales bacterium]